MTGGVPALSVGSYSLRALSVDDAPEVAARASQDDEMRRWSSIGQVTDLASAQAWLASRLQPDRVEWAVRGEAGELMGRVSLHDLDPERRSAEIGYGLFAPFRGRGIARAVVRRVTEYGFGDLGLHRIELEHAVANVRSCGVAQACGYLLEGTMRDALDDHEGGLEDAHLHARLSTDPVTRD